MVTQTSRPPDRLNVEDIGSVRFKADRRQLGGIMLLLGVCATIEPLTDITYFIGEGEFEDRETIQIASFAAGLAQLVFGSVAVVVGFLSLVHDFGNQTLSTSLLVLVQTAWAPFATRIYKLIKDTAAPYETRTFQYDSGGETFSKDYISNPFVPAEYLPTIRDVQLVGSLGILGEISYMVSFYGALAVSAFAISSFDSGKPMARDAQFYRGRLLFYSFVIIVAGISQLLLGAYFVFEFGGGPLSPAINVAMYTCYYPEINIAVGSLQMFIGYYGIARYLGFVPITPHNHHFQIAILLQWICMLALQYIVQISLSTEDGPPAHLSAMVLLSVGLNVLPAFLDYKMRTTPYSISQWYYGTDEALDSRKHHFEDRFENRPRMKRVPSERRKKPAPQRQRQDETNLMNENQRRENETNSMNANQHRGNELHPLMSGNFLDDPPSTEKAQSWDAPISSDRYAVSDPEEAKAKEDEKPYDEEDIPAETEEDKITEEVDFYDKALERTNTITAQLPANRAQVRDSLGSEMEDEDESHESGFDAEASHDIQEMQTRDPPGASRSYVHPSSFDEDSETPDDSTEVLERKLDEIERELYTDSMESFRLSLTEIL
eukprot:scaffold345_cov134-Cylindrotheca_fusiformis.AAC.6